MYFAGLVARETADVHPEIEERLEKGFFKECRLVVCAELKINLLWIERRLYVGLEILSLFGEDKQAS